MFADGLTTPINFTFTSNGEMLVADGFNPPLTGITEHEGNIYVAHRRYVTIIQPDGTKKDIICQLKLAYLNRRS